MTTPAIPESIRDLLKLPWDEPDEDSSRGAMFQQPGEAPVEFFHGRPYARGLNFKRVQAIAAEGLIPDSMLMKARTGIGVNNQFVHSLRQFLYEAGLAYARHLERIEELPR